MMVLSIMMKKVASSKKNTPNPRPECKNHILFITKMTKIDTLVMTKTAHSRLGHK